MKTISLLVIFLAHFSFLSSEVQAQATSPRRITRNVVPPKEAPPTAAPAPATAKPAQKPVVVAAPIIPKTDAEKAEILKKTIDSQKKRAEEGSASAQYDLGVRYLTGDGVEKNLELARKWLEMSAKQGNSAAVQKVERLNKMDPAKNKTEPPKN